MSNQVRALVGAEFLAEVLGLPEGVQIVDASYGKFADCLTLTLEHSSFPEVKLPPFANIATIRHQAKVVTEIRLGDQKLVTGEKYLS